MKIDPIWRPELQQKLFRIMIEATSRPGIRQQLDILNNDMAAVNESTQRVRNAKALLAVIADNHINLCDLHGLLAPSDWSLLQCKPVSAECAQYIVGSGATPPDFTPAIGNLSNPDQSATLILLVESLAGDELTLNLQGPGINQHQILAINGLSPKWINRRQEWVADFPLGVDIYFVDHSSVVALPRSTQANVCAQAQICTEEM